GAALLWAKPAGARAELARAAELAREADDDWALVNANQLLVQTYLLQCDHFNAAAANDEVAALAERVGDPVQVAVRWSWSSYMARIDGRTSEARDDAERARAAVSAVGSPTIEACADFATATIDIWEGQPERAIARLQDRLDRSLKLGAGLLVPG